MTAEDVLAKAADTVEQAWGGPGDPCMAQAIAYQFGGQGDAYGWAHPLTHCALQAVRQELGIDDQPGYWGHIFSWNDAPGRTATEVATVLRNAKRHTIALHVQAT